MCRACISKFKKLDANTSVVGFFILDIWYDTNDVVRGIQITNVHHRDVQECVRNVERYTSYCGQSLDILLWMHRYWITLGTTLLTWLHTSVVRILVNSRESVISRTQIVSAFVMAHQRSRQVIMAWVYVEYFFEDWKFVNFYAVTMKYQQMCFVSENGDMFQRTELALNFKLKTFCI